jgi:putative ABC transport system permease protein
MPEPTRPKPSAKFSRQIVLPWGKSLAMALNNLRIRFFRSIVTAFSLTLAIAFLCYILVNTATARELYRLHGENALVLLSKAGYSLDASGTAIASSPQDIWLMILALLVCTVGIVNAQLMTVTERFREIGIMKCLGALDRIILRLFLIEALIVGLVGSGAGALLGLAVSWTGSLLRFRNLPFTGLDVMPLLTQTASAWGIGIGLAILGVLYPAILAARMQPVIVMREEH